MRGSIENRRIDACFIPSGLAPIGFVTNQLNLLDRVNSSRKPFANQKYFQQLRQGVQNLVNEYKKREGIK